LPLDAQHGTPPHDSSTDGQNAKINLADFMLKLRALSDTTANPATTRSKEKRRRWTIRRTENASKSVGRGKEMCVVREQKPESKSKTHQRRRKKKNERKRDDGEDADAPRV